MREIINESLEKAQRLFGDSVAQKEKMEWIFLDGYQKGMEVARSVYREDPALLNHKEGEE